jgi:hypothetical protein
LIAEAHWEGHMPKTAATYCIWIAAMQVIEAEDAAALLEVDKVLELSSCLCADLWDRDRQASIISRRAQPSHLPAPDSIPHARAHSGQDGPNSS